MKKNIPIQKKLIWLYLTLLILEGGLRKWVLPALATPLLVVRDPIVIYLVIIGFYKGWLNNRYAISMMVVSTISFFVTIVFGHQNFLTAVYGWRVFFFYFPFMFIIGHLLNLKDVIMIGKYIIYISIPMTVLIIFQFYSPQTSFINYGVGGDDSGTSGIGGALGYFRPPGIFSFTSGYVTFQLLVGTYLSFFLLKNNKLSSEYKLSDIIIILAVLSFFLSIPFSISRTHFFQSIVLLLYVTFISIQQKSNSLKLILGTFLFVAITYFLVDTTDYVQTSFSAFGERFKSASISEGGLKGTLVDRYLGSLIRAFNSDIPLVGYGLGFGTNVGAKLLGNENMYTKFNSDQEWVRVFGECGLILGFAIMFIRSYFTFHYFSKSFKILLKEKEILPWLFSVGIILLIAMGQFNANTNLGFAVLFGGLGLATVNKK